MVKTANILVPKRPASIGVQLILFNSYKPPLSPLQNNETLYSWCARIHRLSCSSNARKTCKQLFRHPTCGLRHDFPGNINQLVKNIYSTLSAELLAANHTSLSFFRPFLSKKDFDQLLLLIINGESNNIKGLLGLTKSGVGTPFPLKACPDCVFESLEKYGLSIWNTHYQWPTFGICPIHERHLAVAPDNYHRRAMNQWYLPHDIDFNLWENKHEPSQQISKILTKLASWSIFLQRYNECPLEADLLRLLYHLQAKNHGFIALDGSLKFKQLRLAFIQQYQSIFQISGFQFLQHAHQEHGGFLGVLLRQYPGNRFPLKHIFLMSYLFETTESFGVYYQNLKEAKINHTLCNFEREFTSVRRNLEDLVKSGSSVNLAALSLGINVSSAVKYLQNQQVFYQKKPRVLTDAKETKLIQCLKAGLSKNEIVVKLNLKKSFLRNYLAKNSILKTYWQKRNLGIRKNEYREKFMSVLNENPNLPIKRIRGIPGNGFEWLLNNDLEWLKLQLPCIWRR